MNPYHTKARELLGKINAIPPTWGSGDDSDTVEIITAALEAAYHDGYTQGRIDEAKECMAHEEREYRRSLKRMTKEER